MSTSILPELYRNQANVLGAVVNGSRPATERLSAYDLAEIARQCLDIPLRMKRLNDSYCDRMGSGELVDFGDLNRAREEFRQTFEGQQRLLDSVEASIRVAERDGATVRYAADLRAAVAELAALHDLIFTRWALMEPLDRDAILARIAEEGSTPLDECIDELRRSTR